MFHIRGPSTDPCGTRNWHFLGFADKQFPVTERDFFLLLVFHDYVPWPHVEHARNIVPYNYYYIHRGTLFLEFVLTMEQVSFFYKLFLYPNGNEMFYWSFVSSVCVSPAYYPPGIVPAWFLAWPHLSVSRLTYIPYPRYLLVIQFLAYFSPFDFCCCSLMGWNRLFLTSLYSLFSLFWFLYIFLSLFWKTV